ncbi:MAG TPA: lysylphosphatidylglycerol synthase transmembrane domain-containing protein [Streptosporangiaceae bacterium]|nr:lysylphosphatidylglycerol synthase transmembrane domain-containing protein [Streptosporangiaceae bacterium]
MGDRRPAASLRQAVEHQALLALLAERAGVDVPRVHGIALAPEGAALLVMDLVPGSSLDLLPPGRVTDDLLGRLWTAVARLHDAHLAHRSLRAANVMVDECGRPWLTDFSFAELAASRRQMDLDVAELLASLAIVAGPERAVASAAAVIGTEDLAAAVSLLQPLALSAATRRELRAQKGLLARIRSEAAVRSGRADQELASIQRVKPRTLLAVAVAAAAFYLLLPELAKAGGSWQAVLNADWAWLPVVLAASVLTYVASAISLAGKLILLFGGSALVTLAYIGGLVASVQAFGGPVSIAEIGAAYLATAAIAAASFTPGGVGTFEAVMSAALIGIGIRPSAAVPAVLVYRLATYWLPVAPGWVALHLLQRRELI